MAPRRNVEGRKSDSKVPLFGTQQFADYIGVYRVTFWAWRRAGKIPAPVVDGDGVRSSWTEAQILAWLESGSNSDATS